jgi:ABC-type transport system involved in multi-copper enzyme maturation permease subunit
MSAVAAQMVNADLLKLRKKRGTVIWSLILALGPILIFFVVRAAQHASNSANYGPAGGFDGFHDALRLLALLFGPLSAILIGAEAGAGDAASGVFRDLVVTGRSRVALFAARVPAALAITWLVTIAGYGLMLIGTYAFAGGLPTPGGGMIANGLGFSLLSTGVICAFAVGFASLTNSRPAALTVLIGWDLIASPILASVKSLGKARDALLSQGIVQFSPVSFGEGPHGMAVTMSHGLAIVVMVAWLIVFLGLGVWRTQTMDA